MNIPTVDSLEALIFIASRLGNCETGAITDAERNLVKRVAPVTPSLISDFRQSILEGLDPFGHNFCVLKPRALRRALGATYTPAALVSVMTQWVAALAPARVVDAGAGSGRFIVAAGRVMPKARLVAVECDPMAALMLRAHVAVAGLAKRCRIVVGDYRDVNLPRIAGITAFLGNPPYVRHHQIDAGWKRWYADAARRLGLKASLLAGLHAHFFVATAQKSHSGDVGAFVTASEWLDVNYGELVRKLLLDRLGLVSLHCVDPIAKPFSDADTTAVVSCFQVGQRPKSLRIQRSASLQRLRSLDRGKVVRRERFETSSRWLTLTRSAPTSREGFVELGELCRVHRGQVTGANRIWIAGTHSAELPSAYLYPSITRARELFAAGKALRQSVGLYRVIDIPADLDSVPKRLRLAIETFLRRAQAMGADRGYIASHRKAWWAVGLHEPAPILASYMARRAPAFVRNLAGVRHINIAHGIYPREPLQPNVLLTLVNFLRTSVSVTQGRTYAGGLAKFEPKEMERLLVPAPSLLAQLPRR